MREKRGEDERRELHSLTCTHARERKESEENFPPRASPDNGNISVTRVGVREEKRKEERERGEKEEREEEIGRRDA